MPRVKNNPQPRSTNPPPSTVTNPPIDIPISLTSSSESEDSSSGSDSSIELVSTRNLVVTSSSSSLTLSSISRNTRTNQDKVENLMILLTSVSAEVQQSNALLLAELPMTVATDTFSSTSSSSSISSSSSVADTRSLSARSVPEPSILHSVAQLECPGALVYSKYDRLNTMYLCWNNALINFALETSMTSMSSSSSPSTTLASPTVGDDDDDDDEIVLPHPRASTKRKRTTVNHPSVPTVDTSPWSIASTSSLFAATLKNETHSRQKLLFQTIHKLGTLDGLALVVAPYSHPSSSSSSPSFASLCLQLYALPSLFTSEVSTLYYPEPPKSVQQRQLAILFTYDRLFRMNKHPQYPMDVDSLQTTTDATVYIAEPIIPLENPESFTTVNETTIIPSWSSSSSIAASPLTEQDLYAAARPMSFERADEVDISDPQYTRMNTLLRPTLRRYQRCSLRWLNQRENQSEYELSLSDTELFDGVLYRKVPRSFINRMDRSVISSSSSSISSSATVSLSNDYLYLNPLWGILRTPNGTVCYNNWYSGIITYRTPPLPPIYSLSSGIYADEMGLGKTVVTLGLVASSDNQHRIDQQIRTTEKKNYFFTSKPQFDERKDTVIHQCSSLAAAARIDPDEQSIACICGATFVSILPLQETVYGRSTSPYGNQPSSTSATHTAKKARRSSTASTLSTNRLLSSGNTEDSTRSIDFTQPYVIGRTDGLPWIACSTCHRWQHAICSGMTETDIANTEFLKHFLCTECECALACGKPILSTANIVVCPVPILAQWQSEIRKHIRTVTFDIPDRVPTTNHDPSLSPSKPLQVIYYAGIKSTIRALQKCTHALSYYVILLQNLVKEETNLREIYGEQIKNMDTTNDGNGDATVTETMNNPTNEQDIRLAEADAKATGTAIGISDSAIIIAGDIYTIAIKDLVMKTNVILRGLRRAEFQMDTGTSVANTGISSSAASSSLSGGSRSSSQHPTNNTIDIDAATNDDEGNEHNSKRSNTTHIPVSPKGTPQSSASIPCQPWDWYTELLSVLSQIRKAQTTATAAAVRLAHSLSPRYLAEADIVITTYAALQDDINNADTVTTEILSASEQIGTIVDRTVTYNDQSTASVNEIHTILTDRLVRMFKGDNSWYLDNEPSSVAWTGGSSSSSSGSSGTTAIVSPSLSSRRRSVTANSKVIDIDGNTPVGSTNETVPSVHVQNIINKLAKNGTHVHRVHLSSSASFSSPSSVGTGTNEASTGTPTSTTPKYKDKTRLGIMIDSATGTITGSSSATSKGIFSLHEGLNIASAGRKLRHAKKYRVVPTPLLYVYWYRCLLDEAQLIDVPTAKAAVMVRRLFAQHRWAISGTPLSRSVHDLFGIFLFLGIPIYNDKDIFHRYILRSAENGNPHARLLLLRLANVLIWRTRKTDVADELGVPPLTDETLIITPSRIEEAFYKREFRRILKRIEPVLQSWRKEEREARQALTSSSSLTAFTPSSSSSSSSLSSSSRAKSKWLLGDRILTRREQQIIMLPLLSIRQSCVHPQIASQTLRLIRRGIGSTGNRLPASNEDDMDDDGPTRRGTHNRKTPMTMLQVLDSMIVKAKQDCEEAQRDIIASHNGLAGLEILRNGWKKAMEHYETVINLGTAVANLGNKTEYVRNEIIVRIDPLPRIHALRNYLFCVQAMTTQGKEGTNSKKNKELGKEEDEEMDTVGMDGTDNGKMTIVPTTQKLHQEKLQREAQTLEDDFLRVSAFTVVTEIKQTEKVMQTLCGLCSCKVDTRDDDKNNTITEGKDAVSDSLNQPASSFSLTNAYRYGHSLPESDTHSLFRTLLSLAQPLESVLTVTVNTLLGQIAASTTFTKDILDQASSTALQSDDAHLFVAEGAGSLAWPVKSIDTLRLLVLHALQELFKVREKALHIAMTMLQPSSADLLLSANCKICRADWGKKGPICTHCKAKTYLRTYLTQLIGYRAQTLTGNDLEDENTLTNGGGEKGYPLGEITASGRRKRKRQSIIPGKDGNLEVWLQNETKKTDGDDGEDGGSNRPDGTMEMDEISAKFAVPTALYRVLKFLGTAGKGFRMDIGEIITQAFGSTASLRSTDASAEATSNVRLTVDTDTTIPSLVQGAVEYRHTTEESRTLLPVSSSSLSSKSKGSSLASLSAGKSTTVTRTVIGINTGVWLDRTVSLLETEARKLLEGLWRRQADFLSNIDELTQSLTRMQLAAPQQQLTETEELYIVHESMIPSRIKELKLTLISSESDLRKAKGHLIYLLNIQAEENGHTLMSPSSSLSVPTLTDGGNHNHTASISGSGKTDPNCLICLDTLGSQSNGQIVIIPQCGHRFCKTCLQRLMNLSKVRHEWYGRRPPTCPYDRKVFEESTLIYAVRKRDEGRTNGPSSSESVAKSQGETTKMDETRGLITSLSSPSSSTVSADGTASSTASLVTWEPSAVLPSMTIPSSDPSFDPSSSGTFQNFSSGTLTDSSASLVPIGPPGSLQHLYSKSSLIHLHMLDDPELMVLGSYGSKIEALVRCIQALLTSKDVILGEELRQAGTSLTGGNRKTDADEMLLSSSSLSSSSSSSVPSIVETVRQQRQQRPVQCLVFSQWDEALQIAEAACVRNSIACLRLKSTRHISEILQTFVSNPRITVLLLPFKSGAEGLNITCANHVFFLEPLLEPATEQQAIGRVHRMGQELATFVHRFIIKDTVEATILAINEHRLQKLQRISGGNRRASVLLNIENEGDTSSGGGSEKGPITVALKRRIEQFLLALAFPTKTKTKATSTVSGTPRQRIGTSVSTENDNAMERKDSEEENDTTNTDTNEGTGVTRMDIITMFEGEMAFARQLEIMGGGTADKQSMTSTGRNGDHGSTTVPSTTTVAADTNNDENMDKDNEAIQGSTTLVSSSSSSPKHRTPDTTDNMNMKQIMQEVRQNNEFWNTRILYNGEHRLRLAILASYLQTTNGTTENTVVLYGRKVDAELAKRLTRTADSTG